MNASDVVDQARALVAGDRGLLAMDESNPTCNKRFAKLQIPQTEEARRAYREWIVATHGRADCISGVILYDETFRQRTRDGTPFVQAVLRACLVPGIKVGTGRSHWQVTGAKQSPKASMACANASSSTPERVPDSPSGAR